MRNMIVFIMIFASLLFAADSTAVVSTNSSLTAYITSPSDVVTYDLFNNTEDVSDTIAATDHLILGPFPLYQGVARALHYKSFNVVGGSITAADSVALEYQMTATKYIADSASNWTAWDTVGGVGGPRNNVVDLSTKTGGFLFVRVTNFTAATVAEMYNWLKLKMRSNHTGYVNQ